MIKMKRNTIKWRIFKYNLIVIIVLIALSTIVFNFAIRVYMENENKKQLALIASRTEDTALRRGPDFFNDKERIPPLHEITEQDKKLLSENDFLAFYFSLDRSLREPLSVLNADYILLDSEKKVINSLPDEFKKTSEELNEKIINEIGKLEDLNNNAFINLKLSGVEYIVVARNVSGRNSFGLSWVIIYSSLEKVNQLQTGINIMLFIILVISSIIIALISSLAAKKISAPFSALNGHIGAIAERNFGKILISVDDEMQDLVNNINIMSEKLESYDKAQKTFLQNASHEFRTPLMSIQSYAEGIKYDVIENTTAADIIIEETKRMTLLVENLLYLSRLDAIEENYHFETILMNEFLNTYMERMRGIAAKGNIQITSEVPEEAIEIYADEDKLSRAITNIVGNCIRYAQSMVKIICILKPEVDRIEIMISDDGPGFETEELPVIFERFYKGKKGNSGLGLAISKAVIEKHNGSVSAENTGKGALFRIELPLK